MSEKERKKMSNRTSSRPDWDTYFLDMVDTVASRATCDRGRSGCVVTRDKRIIATGYVGSPPGLPHCDDVGHDMRSVTDADGRVTHHCVRTLHAEQNAIAQAAKNGLSFQGATLYCRMEPCRVCAMLIASCGIVRVVAQKRYHAAQDSRLIFEQAGIELRVYSDECERYDKQ